MRIVVHGQQAFGKAVLEALLKRGENVVAVYVAPEKEAPRLTRSKRLRLRPSFRSISPPPTRTRKSGKNSRR